MKTKRRWTKEELEFLKENYPTIKTRELKDILNRTMGSIETRAKRLHIKKIYSNGYERIYLPNHPFKNINGVIPQHRYIMEQWLIENNPNSKYLIEIDNKKYLNPKFVVHHINENTRDNRIENLKVMTDKEHSNHHNKGKKGRWKLSKDTRRKIGDARRGEKHPNWKNGISLNKKEYMKGYMEEYNQIPEVKERNKEKGRKFYQRNKEKIKQYHKNYYLKNKENILEKSRKCNKIKYRKEYPLKELNCLICNKIFKQKRRGHIYCSKNCVNKAYYNRTKIKKGGYK